MAIRAIVAVLILAAVAFAGSSPELTASATGTHPAVIDWAQGRFVAAGLVFPEVMVVTHDDLLHCGGHVGMYHPGRDLLELCRIDDESVLHELAHAWADLNLTNEDRTEFVAHRGTSSWNGQSEEWSERATEQAAEIIVWALLERDTAVKWVEGGVAGWRLLTIPDSSPERLAAGFELLTGRPVPDGRCVEARCESDQLAPVYRPGR